MGNIKISGSNGLSKCSESREINFENCREVYVPTCCLLEFWASKSQHFFRTKIISGGSSEGVPQVQPSPQAPAQWVYLKSHVGKYTGQNLNTYKNIQGKITLTRPGPWTHGPGPGPRRHGPMGQALGPDHGPMPMCPGAKALAHEYFDIWAHKYF